METPARKRPFNFCGLPQSFADYVAARFVVLPVPYEGTVTYQQGTARGPQAVIDASRYMELYDEELKSEIYRVGIHTAEPLEVKPRPEDTVKEVERAVGEFLADDKVGVLLGGEHSVTFGAVAACRRKFSDLCVLQLDAHTDLRDEYDGTRFSHACVMRRCLEIAPVTQVGIRSLSRPEADLLESDPNVTTYFAHDLRATGLASRHDEILSTLTEQVYLTMDIDVFDPAFVPGTGTPEPGGLDWTDVTGLIRALCAKKQVVGFDVVEVLPLPGSVVSEFLAAKLIYRTMGYIAATAGWKPIKA